jgi:hypothetical protein
MRFTDPTSLMQVLKYSAQRLTRILTVPVTNGYRKLRQWINPNGFTSRVMSDVRRGGQDLIQGKPSSLRDYVSYGNYYIAKKLLFLIALALLVVPILFFKYLYPVIRQNLLTVTMPVNSVERMSYTGKVRLLSEKGGTTLYRGRLEEGRVTGKGVLYDYAGNRIYEGGFLMEQYDGSGQTYWPNGKICYTGTFAANQYEGRGMLYSENGDLLFDGNFAAGAYEGLGKLYGRSGQLLYTGNFASGRYDGQGVLYQDGSELYEGTFTAGQMEGTGKLYSGKTVIYEGEFAGGTFSGAGKAYDPLEGRLVYDGAFSSGKYEGQGRLFDAESGALVYEGGFYQGVYEGDGKLYNPKTGLPVYEGGFRAGRYDGTGTEYDATLGTIRYKGDFLLGVYHGSGTEYDPVTGFVTASGEYRNGQLVVIGEDGNPVGEVTAPSAPASGGGSTSGGGTSGGGTSGGSTSGGSTSGGSTSGGGTSGGGTSGGGTTGGAKVYTGPTTASGGIDYQALASMSAAQLRQQFTTQPASTWSVSGGSVQIYADQTDKVGLAVQTTASGAISSIGVWNDAPVAGGAKTGMSKAELTAALGAPASTEKETMGAGRMLAISQSNQYFGRLTNLSPESSVTVSTYNTAAGTVRAIFAGKLDQCLLLEIVP